ncbi:MAG: hypothetical protein M3327_02355 [Actinomycetota bacterium]|nr:hypothetical protein [Actinomycetota bacterium]
MTRRHFHNLEAVRTAGEAPNAETAFFLAAFTFGLAMLSLFAVVAIAGFVEVLDILPFFALPLVLFAASALVVRRWLMVEDERTGVREAVHRSSRRQRPKPAGLDDIGLQGGTR